MNRHDKRKLAAKRRKRLEAAQRHFSNTLTTTFLMRSVNTLAYYQRAMQGDRSTALALLCAAEWLKSPKDVVPMCGACEGSVPYSPLALFLVYREDAPENGIGMAICNDCYGLSEDELHVRCTENLKPLLGSLRQINPANVHDAGGSA